MTIKSELNAKNPPDAVGYPCLKVGEVTGCLYLFTEKNKCVGLSGARLGEIYDCASSDCYALYHGSITLTQE